MLVKKGFVELYKTKSFLDFYHLIKYFLLKQITLRMNEKKLNEGISN